MRKMLKTVISLLLVMTLALVTPLQALGQEITADAAYADSAVGAEIPESSTESSRSEILCELTEKRDANTKHFLMSDGTMMAAQYNDAVHYQTESGWEQYDNSMTLSDETASDDNKEYINKKSDQTVKLAKKAKETKTVTYKYQDFEISWGYADSRKAELELINSTTKKSGNDRFLVLDNVTQQAKYPEIFTYVDLELIVSSSGIKENIILKSSSAQNEFEIEYKLKNLEASQVDDKTVVLKDANGKDIYTINAPAMYDAAGVYSSALTLKITEQSNNKLTLVLTADEEWLKSKDRAYPVTVDPSFYTTTRSENLKAITVYTGTAPAYSKKMLYASDGNYGGFGKTVSVVKFETLPQLNPGDVVIDAQLTVFRNDMESTSSKVQVYASRVDSLPGNYDTAQYRAKWDSAFSYSSRIEDYEIETGSSSFQQRNFNITKSVKEWYSGEVENNGICLSSYCATTNWYYVRYCLTNYSQYTPAITITYRNAIGLESYWTYHSQSVGHGNAFINDFSGNLVYQLPIFSGTGVKNPAAMSFYYNSNISNIVGGTAIAKGWTSNFGQRIVSLSNLSGSVNTALVSNGYHYAYVDADETYHYLKKKSDNVYVDEDGLKLTLNVDPASATNRYTLKFNSGGQCVFGSGGNLLQIVDSLGIAIRLDYDANVRPTRIQDGAGRKYYITWENGRMTKVTEPDGSVITISYNSSSGQLEQVTYADGTYTRFSYNTYVSEGQTYYRLSRVTAFNGSYLDYTYRTASLRYAFAERTICTGIASVTEYTYDSTTKTVTKGAILSIKHNNDTSATFTYTRDTVSNSEMYVFDALGRSTSALYSDGSATDLTYTATASGQSGSDTNNRISSVTSGDKISDNLLKDGNLEKITSQSFSDYWTSASYNGGFDENFYGDEYIGKGIYLFGYGYGISGFKQRVLVYTNHTYTFSAYAKGKNANLFVAYEIAGKEVLQPLRSSVTASDVEWTRLSLTFTVPENVSYAWVIFGHENGPNSDSVHFDNLQLEIAAEIEGNNNLLENPKFGDLSNNWTLKDADPLELVSAGFDPFGNYCGFDGNVLYNTKLSQTVNINKRAVAFKASVLARVQSVCIEDTKTCALKALVTYTDNTTQTYSKNFNTFSTAQQRITLSFVPNPAKTVKNVEYIIDFSKNIGYITLYETSLEMDETSAGYAYDQNGNMVTSKESSGKENDYVYYDDTDLVAKSINSIGEVTYASYDSKFKYNPLVQWSAQTSLGTFYTYNSNGTLSTTTVGTAKNIVANDSTKTYSSVLDTSKPYIRTSVGYESTGNYVTSSTDSRGNTSTSNIDYLNGRLNSQTNAAGVTTNYTYDDATKLLTEISSQDSSVKYSYDSNRRLTSIETGSSVYFFEYDKWGNTTKTKVGDTTLASTEYVAATSLPSKMTYGNGSAVSYSYDKFDRITEKYFGSALAEKYVYNNSGLVGRYTDMLGTAAGPLTTVYSYDLRNRLIGKFNQNYSVNYAYDSLDRTTAVKYNIDGITFKTAYIYGKDSLLTGSSLDGVYTQSYSYDNLNRVTTKNTTVGGSVLLSDSYTYLNNADGSSTTLVSGYSSGGKTYNYTYDALGNITSETVGGVTKQYTYDSLGQLVRSTEGSKVTEYTYDHTGNILSKKAYNNNTAYGTSTQYEQESDAITYFGNWATLEIWSCSNHSMYRTRDVNAYATFDFTGTKLSLLTYKSPTRGVLCYQIDGGEVIEYDCTDELTDVWFKFEVVLAENLDPFTTHTVKIFPKETNGNLWIDIDAFIVTNGDRVINYTYGNAAWGDQLTAYDGQSITYDAIGNPLSYKGATLTWENGRRLASYNKGTDTLFFTYNASGLRTSKTVNGVITEYIWDENTLLAQKTGDESIYFIYDTDGVLGFKYGEETYYYTKNLQGDIVGIRDSIGNDVVEYTYDDWGKILSVTGDTELGNKNPLRYRGYMYDEETGLYYVSSRYYDPEIGRWISPEPNVYNGEFDEGAGLIGYNVYAYCANNPVMFKDETGESITLACILIFGGIGLLAGGHFAAKASKAKLGYVNGWWVLGGMVVGGGVGALLGWGVGSAATAIGAKLAAGSSGTLGKVIYSSWQSAEKALRTAYKGAKATFNTPWGKRIIDSYSKNVIREAKYGYQGLSQFIQQEINKDVWILKNTSVKSIEWHFYWSSVSNSGGPSGPLLKELARCGIKVIFH